MLHVETIYALCYGIHTKHTNTLSENFYMLANWLQRVKYYCISAIY